MLVAGSSHPWGWLDESLKATNIDQLASRLGGMNRYAEAKDHILKTCQVKYAVIEDLDRP